MIIKVNGKYDQYSLRLGYHSHSSNEEENLFKLAQSWAPKECKSMTFSEENSYFDLLEKRYYHSFRIQFFTTVKEGQVKLED